MGKIDVSFDSNAEGERSSSHPTISKPTGALAQYLTLVVRHTSERRHSRRRREKETNIEHSQIPPNIVPTLPKRSSPISDPQIAVFWPRVPSKLC
jgi:hypothetical protein